jgi:hypothetical protein
LEQHEDIRIVSMDDTDQAAAVPIKAMRRNADMGLIFTRKKRGEAIAIRL